MPAAPSNVAIMAPKNYGAVTSGSDTIGALSGSNLWAFVDFFSDSGGSGALTSVCTIGGFSAVRIMGGTSGGARNFERWGVAAAFTGMPAVSWARTSSGNVYTIGGVYKDVDQTSPVDLANVATALGGPDTVGGGTIVSAAGKTVVDFLSDTGPFSDGGDVDAFYSAIYSGMRRVGSLAGPTPLSSDCPGAASVTCGWNRAVTDFWCWMACSLNPVSGVTDFLMGQQCL